MRRLIAVLVVAGALAAPVVAFADPEITYSCSPTPASCSGWYRAPVTVYWSWTPTNARVLSGCDSNDPVDFDTKVTMRSCEVIDDPDGDGVGPSEKKSVPLRVDTTAPLVTGAAASRPPDHNGWYTSPVQVTFSGNDVTSGLAGCSAASYSGPNAAAVNVLGRCQDKAGNVSAPSPFGLRYDSVPPSLAGVAASPSDGKVRLSWDVPDATSVDVWRRRGDKRERVVDGGAKGRVVDRHLRNGRSYTYDVRAVDPAGNAADRTITVVPGPRLLVPAAGARVPDPPMLRWTPVHGARYYNVQIFRGRHKVLSVWPARPRLQLDGAWRFSGERRRLVAGHRYRWFVWPGRGPRAANQYGPLVGTRTFTFGAP